MVDVIPGLVDREMPLCLCIQREAKGQPQHDEKDAHSKCLIQKIGRNMEKIRNNLDPSSFET